MVTLIDAEANALSLTGNEALFGNKPFPCPGLRAKFKNNPGSRKKLQPFMQISSFCLSRLPNP
ncbi:MAG: hypothetical protein WBR26_03895 [Candidatus Acidiferrum sp.]